MHLDDHVRTVHDQLSAAAALGDERTREIAEALGGTASSAVRLALLGALSELAAEVTAHLLEAHGGPTVAVRLDGEDVLVDVTGTGPVAESAATPTEDGDASARISLRLSERLKGDVEKAAAREGQSVNSWLVRAATQALDAGSGGWGQHRGRAAGQRISGWVTG